MQWTRMMFPFDWFYINYPGVIASYMKVPLPDNIGKMLQKSTPISPLPDTPSNKAIPLFHEEGAEELRKCIRNLTEAGVRFQKHQKRKESDGEVSDNYRIIYLE